MLIFRWISFWIPQSTRQHLYSLLNIQFYKHERPDRFVINFYNYFYQQLNKYQNEKKNNNCSLLTKVHCKQDWNLIFFNLLDDTLNRRKKFWISNLKLDKSFRPILKCVNLKLKKLRSHKVVRVMSIILTFSLYPLPSLS